MRLPFQTEGKKEQRDDVWRIYKTGAVRSRWAGCWSSELLITIAFGTLGLLLTVPLLATLIVLIGNALCLYDLLSLRSISIELSTNSRVIQAFPNRPSLQPSIENEGHAPSSPKFCTGVKQQLCYRK